MTKPHRWTTGWRRVKFGDVVRLNTERVADPAAAGLERYLGLEHIEPEDLRIRRWGLVADGTTFTNRFRPGQVLFGKRRAYQRKVAVADFDGVCSGDIYIFESKDPAVLLPELLPFLCQTEGFYEHAVGTSAGSLSPRTNWMQLAQYEFALPPVEEQRRLTRVMSAAQHTSESLVATLSKARDLLRSSIDFLSDQLLSHLVTIEQAVRDGVIETPQDGNHGDIHPKASDYVEQGIPFLMAADIVDGRANLVSCKFITDLSLKSSGLFGIPVVDWRDDPSSRSNQRIG